MPDIVHIPKGIRAVTDSPTLKRVLAVSDDLDLLHTRVLLLESQGYIVEAVANDNEAMNLLLTTDFDLVLLGSNSSLFGNHLDRRIRHKYPKMLTLKIQSATEELSIYASRTVDTVPQHVIAALRQMLSED